MQKRMLSFDSAELLKLSHQPGPPTLLALAREIQDDCTIA
jgi:hypothetical protein